MELQIGTARALDDGFEIAGQQSIGLAERRDTNRLKVLFEECSGPMRVVRTQLQSSAADVPQCAMDWSVVAGVRIFAQRLAARLISRECGEVIID